MSGAPSVKLIVNGAEHDVRDGMTARELVESLGLRPEVVVVERNEEVVKRAALGATLLAPGDRIEIIQMIAGG
jgi:thiamine biosynthesis protein ThiS